MPTRDNVYVAATGILALCAAVLTFNNVQATYFRPPSIPLHTFTDWRSYAETGQRMGPADPRVALVLFFDFECPACRALTTTLDEIREEYPESVSVVIRHWPIPGHKLAPTAAYASICAERFGRFEPMFRLLIAEGTLAGDPDWLDIAARVGIADTASFVGCMRDARTDSLVKADIADAARVGAMGTPTLLVNNEEYFGIPRDLRTIVRRHLDAQPLP
jgi:protein-disulfide isomerase